MFSNSNLLLPHRYLIIGWGLLIASLFGAVAVVLLGITSITTHVVSQTVYSVTMTMFYVALLLLCVSREKNEDEYISALRSRIACIVIACALILKTFVTIATAICITTNQIELLGSIRYLSIPVNFVVPVIAYIAIFQITLFVSNRRLKKYAE